MSKKVILAVVVVLIIGAIGVFLANQMSQESGGGSELQFSNEPTEVTRPTVEAREDTFTIMTPEQIAAREAAELEAQTALAASTSASTTVETEETSSDQSED